MEEQAESRLIYAFPRSQDERVQFILKKYRGKYYLDLRIWFKTKEKEELYPTKKGIFIPLDQIAQFRKGFEQAAKSVEKTPSREAVPQP